MRRRWKACGYKHEVSGPQCWETRQGCEDGGIMSIYSWWYRFKKHQWEEKMGAKEASPMYLHEQTEWWLKEVCTELDRWSQISTPSKGNNMQWNTIYKKGGTEYRQDWSKRLVFECPVWSFAFKRLGLRPRPVHIILKPAKDWTELLKTGLQQLVLVFLQLQDWSQPVTVETSL